MSTKYTYVLVVIYDDDHYDSYYYDQKKFLLCECQDSKKLEDLIKVVEDYNLKAKNRLGNIDYLDKEGVYLLIEDGVHYKVDYEEEIDKAIMNHPLYRYVKEDAFDNSTIREFIMYDDYLTISIEQVERYEVV